MINGIFFDLFGTLLEYGDMTKAWGEWLNTFHKLLIPHGLNITKEEFASACDKLFTKDAPASEIDGMTVYEYRIDRLCRSLNISLNKSYIKKTADETVKTWQNEITMASDCLETLQILKKTKKLVLITNFDHPPHVNRILSKFGLDHFFEEIVISSDVGYKKPDPEIFRIALNRISLKAQEVVYVGDTEDDINGAIASGMKPVLIGKDLCNNQIAYDYNHNNPIKKSERLDKKLNVLTISKLFRLTELFP